MKRAWMGLSLAALIPLAAACSRPAKAPSGAGMTAPGEGAAPSGQEAPSQGAPSGKEKGEKGEKAEKGEQGALEAPYGEERGAEAERARREGEQGLGSGIGQGQQAGQPGEGEKAGVTSEKQLCEALAQGARMRVEDVMGGVAIVLTPRGGTQLASIRDHARKLEGWIQTGAAEGAAGGPRSGETCGIAELGRLPSVTTSLSEAANSVRIRMTTANPTEVRDLRRMARDEVNALTKSQGGQQPNRPKSPKPGGQHEQRD